MFTLDLSGLDLCKKGCSFTLKTTAHGITTAGIIAKIIMDQKILDQPKNSQLVKKKSPTVEMAKKQRNTDIIHNKT